MPENTENTDAGTEVALKDGWGTETTTTVKIPDGTEVTGLAKVSTVYAVSDGKIIQYQFQRDFTMSAGQKIQE